MFDVFYLFSFSTNGAKAQYKGFNCMFDTNIICFYEILYQLSSLATSCWLAVFTGFFFFFTILGIFLLMVIALHFLLTTAPLLVRREGLVRRGRGGEENDYIINWRAQRLGEWWPIILRPIHGLSGLSDPTKLERYLHDFFSVEVWPMRNLFVYFLYRIRNIHCWNFVPLHIFCDNISIHHEILIGKIGVTNVILISFCWQQIGTKMPYIHVCMDSYLWTNYMIFFLQKLAFWTFSCFVSTFVSNCCTEHPSMPIMQLHRQPLFALPDSQAGKCSLSYLYPFSVLCTSSHGTTATRFNSFND